MGFDRHLYRCPHCHEALEPRGYVLRNGLISAGELVCPDCRQATPILRGMCLFTETTGAARGEKTLAALDHALFGTGQAYLEFVAQQASRPVYDAYAAYTPFNEALAAFQRFHECISSVLKPGDTILDLNNRTGWTGEFLAASFPEQRVLSIWYGNMGALGYRGFGHWLTDRKRSSNLEFLFLGDMGALPLDGGSVGLVFGYDYLHHHASSAELEELLRITRQGGLVYFSHVHTGDAEPNPWFERGGTLLTSPEWCEKLDGLRGLGERYPVLLGELACFRNESLNIQRGVAGDDYNVAAIIGPANWQGLEVPLPEVSVPDGDSLILQNPLLEVDLTTGQVVIEPDSMAGGVGYLMSRHPRVVEDLRQVLPNALTILQRMVLYWAAKGLSWTAIREKLPGLPEDADRALRDMTAKRLVLALPVSVAMWQLQQFYNHRRLVYPAQDQKFSTLWRDLEVHYPDAAVLVDSDGSEFNAANTRLLVDATICLLDGHGIGKGDKVVILSTGHTEAFFVTWAAWLMGAVAVVLNPGREDSWLAEMITQQGAGLVFTEDRWQGGLIQGCTFLEFDDLEATGSRPGQFSECIEPWLGKPLPRLEPISEQDMALILSTSGSTGEPKLVKLSQGALFRSGEALSRTYRWQSGDRLLVLGPFYSMSGLRNSAIASLHTGTTVVLASSLAQRSFTKALQFVEDMDVSIVTTVPSFIEHVAQLLQRGDFPELSKLRQILSTASRLDTKTISKLRDDMDTEILDYYGLSETCGVCIAQLPGSEPRENSIGHAINSLVAIRDSEGNEVSDGEAGELHIYTDNLMSGYVGDPESGLRIVDGWLATGDQAKIENDGEIILFDRLDGAEKNRQGEFIEPG